MQMVGHFLAKGDLYVVFSAPLFKKHSRATVLIWRQNQQSSKTTSHMAEWWFGYIWSENVKNYKRQKLQKTSKTALLIFFKGCGCDRTKNCDISDYLITPNFPGLFVSKLNSESEKRDKKLIPY